MSESGQTLPLIVSNIGRLYTMNDASMGILSDADVHIEKGRITYVGSSVGAPEYDKCERLDAQGCALLPGFVDAHTHALFAGSRVHEYELRARGASYSEIMESGGGILNTVKAVRAASADELSADVIERAERMLERGVTTFEVKSGYGLSLEDELKSLQAIALAQEKSRSKLIATCLAAHAIPPEFSDESDAYVQLICEEILPEVAVQKLAAFVDAFIDRGAFTLAQGRKVLQRARDLGFELRVHAEQLSHTGAAGLACELGALSVSHVEHISRGDIDRLAKAGVIAEVLSTAQVFLGMERRIPGRALCDAGVLCAVATDFNPGSAPSLDLALAGGLAVSMCGLTVAESLLGMTRIGALSLGLTDYGLIREGGVGDLVLLDCEDAAQILYEWGERHVRSVVKSGVVVFDASL